MLDLLKNDYKFLFNVLDNVSKNKGCGHAFLFDSCSDFSNNLVIYFIKMLLCPHGGIYSKKCEDCFLCSQIDAGNCMDLKIIDGSSSVIKKEDILKLQEEFSTISLSNGYRIYLIKNLENITSSASNALLKFLEEPCVNVIAILMTNNIKMIFPTIISRCQIIRVSNYFKYSANTIDNLFKLGVINDEFNIEKLTEYINIIKLLENNGIKSICQYKKILKSFSFDKRDNLIVFLDIFIYFYYDVLIYDFVSQERLCFIEFDEDIKMIKFLNNKDKIQNKLFILFNAKENIKYNVNINLFFDCLIIDLYGGE